MDLNKTIISFLSLVNPDTNIAFQNGIYASIY